MGGFALVSFAILLALRPGLASYRFFGAFPWAEILALVASALALKAWRRRDWRVLGEARDAGPLIAVMFFYPLIPALAHAFHRPDQDEWLHRMDQALFGGVDLLHSMEAWVSGPLSAWMAFCYSFYGFLVLLVFTWLCLRDEREALEKFVFEFTCLMLGGYLGYLLVPAIGPLYTQEFQVPIDLPEYLAALKERLMDRPRIDRDCFPSLHTAISVLCWLQTRDSFGKVAPWLLPVVVTIPFACLYLRYHYAVDVLAGFALVAAVRLLSARIKNGKGAVPRNDAPL